MWDLDAGTRSSRTLISNSFWNRTLAISPDGRWLANSTTTGTIQLFNLTQPGSEFTLLEGHKGWIGALCFSPDGRTLYSASQDNTIMTWDLLNADVEGLTFMTLTNDIPQCMEISPSGNWLFCGTQQGRLIRWNTDTREQTILYSGSSAIIAISINPTGSRIAFGDQNGMLRVADVNTSSITQSISAHTAQIKDLDFSPDGQQIATGSYDRTAKIWNANSLSSQQPIVVDKHNAYVMSVTFSPDGRHLLSSSQYENSPRNQTLYFWPTHNQFMAERICGELGRNMTETEWENYVSEDIPYENTCP
jgi:WD40 repeat protein